MLKAILWKNLLLKRANVFGTLGEILIPVFFMALLILIKSITSVYDSPNVAYYCGQAFPWFYSESLPTPWNPNDPPPPTSCAFKPAECTTPNYYQAGYYYVGNTKAYTQYGYVQSASSSGESNNPYYTFQIADNTTIYEDTYMFNPSLPMTNILELVQGNKAKVALAPVVADPVLTAHVANLTDYIVAQTNPSLRSAMITFEDQDALESYIKSKDYDHADYGEGKIAMAIVVYAADVVTATFDYSIRVNFSYGFGDPGQQASVACLYGYNPGFPDNTIGWDDCQTVYSIPTTKYYTSDLYKPQSTSYMFGYSYSGYATLQKMVDSYIFSLYGEPTSVMASVSMMPTSTYQTDNFQFVISSVLGIFYMLSFLYPISRTVRALVVEKETRVKEGMKMMGLTDSVYNLSWFITTTTQMTIVSGLITLVTGSSVFEYSNKVLVFLYFEVFSLAAMNMCYLMATFFSRSKAASLLGPMIFFGSFFPYYAVSDPQFATGTKAATCLLAPACFALGANVYADFEGGLVGVQVDNSNTMTSNFSYSICIGMMFFDAVLYGVLAWYLDKVLPSEFGSTLPWYFPFMSSYWCGHDCCGLSKPSEQALSAPLLAKGGADYESGEFDDVDNLLHASGQEVGDYKEETVPADLLKQRNDGRCVRVRGLRKVFAAQGGSERVAVNGLTMDLYEGQVTVLLGHNGAGKSTSINMLVGLTTPTSGDALMCGQLRISRDMNEIRRNLGVCPQHDILFSELTVMQHLQMFASFKGLPAGEVDSEAKRMLAEVGLVEKANAKASTLSGGQKRKLSVGIALIGNSKIVILDEPTSGMDPYSRRSTWNIIQRNKKGRVILLTTHFMDEADILGDRIAIMAEGKLQCVGSSLFLKSAYGVGYTLTLVKDAIASNSSASAVRDSQVDSSQGGAQLQLQARNAQKERRDQQTAEINELVTRFVPVAEPLSTVGAEQSFRLPFAASSQLASLFEEIERTKTRLLIAEYGISVTTLEEVFMRVGKSVHSDKSRLDAEAEESANTGEPVVATPIHESLPAHDQRSGSFPYDRASNTYKTGIDQSREMSKIAANSQISQPEPEWQEDSGFSAFYHHFRALLIKRAIIGKRDQRMVLCQLVLPVVLVVLGLGLLMIRPSLDQPDYILSSQQFNPDLNSGYRNYVPILVANNNAGVNPIPDEIVEKFSGSTNGGVAGVAVPVTITPEYSSINPDGSFYACSLGADPLYNMSDFLIQTQDTKLEHGSSRYGAVTIDGSTTEKNLVYNVMINASAMHGVGVFVNEVHDAYLEVKSKLSTASITTRNFPLPTTFKQDNEQNSASAFVTALFCMIAFCFIPASFATFVVKEREVKAKHQQVISGVSIYAYWTSTWVWDTVSYLPTAALVIAAVYMFGVDSYTQGDAGAAYALLFLLAGPAVASFTYIVSYIFVSHSTAQIMVMFINFLTGLCLMVVSFVLTVIPSTMKINLSLRYLFRLFPAFCLGDGLVMLSVCVSDPNYPGGISCPLIDGENGFDFSGQQSPLAWDITGGNLTFLAVEAIIYFLITILIEYALTFPTLAAWLYSAGLSDTAPPAGFEDEDVDVRAERRRVAEGGADGDIVKISELRKLYQPAGSRLTQICSKSSSADKSKLKVAVQSLSFGIPKGECFGFLGINGAGKTTTLSILSGEFPPTSGTAFIDGFNIADDQSKIRRRIGYCPQFDAILELLTVREHLELFGRIKGMKGANLQRVVRGKLTQLDLVDFENKTAGSLSGGNKRKLSVAMATIGEPPIVFLDEPSTGMDPVARRFMWQVIARMSTQDGRCSVILTTHSMEEAEALCTRIGVMVNGRLQCLGSAQHLKLRFGDGFEVNVKTAIPNSEDLLKAATSLIRRNLLQIQFGKDANMSALSAAHLEATAVSKGQVISLLVAMKLISLDEAYSMEAQELLHLIDAEGGMISLKTVLEWAWAEKAGKLLETFMNKLSRGDNVQWTTHAAGGSPNNGLKKAALEDEEWSRSSSTATAVAPAGFARLLERSTAHSFRYRLQVNVATLETLHQQALAKRAAGGGNAELVAPGTSALAYIFRHFEINKQRLRVQEYSVGQTTLEQIFNQFAATQDNPEVAAIHGQSSEQLLAASVNPLGTGRRRRGSSADYVVTDAELESFL